MSTSEQIREIYEAEIADKTRVVFNKCGISPFYEDFDGFQIEGLYSGLGIDSIICSEYTPKSKKRARCL
jgi:hypothetical protein